MSQNNSTDDANADAEAALRYFIRNGIPFGIVAKTNEEQIAQHAFEQYEKEKAEMQEKWKSVGTILLILTTLVTVTAWATRASNAAEEARAEIKQVEVRVNEKVGEANGIAQSAQKLAQDQAIINGQQDSKIEALKEDVEDIKEQNNKILEILIRLERKDR